MQTLEKGHFLQDAPKGVTLEDAFNALVIYVDSVGSCPNGVYGFECPKGIPNEHNIQDLRDMPPSTLCGMRRRDCWKEFALYAASHGQTMLSFPSGDVMWER